MISNRFFAALAVAGIVGIAACDQQDDVRVDDTAPATEVQTTDPGFGTTDPATTPGTTGTTDPALTPADDTLMNDTAAIGEGMEGTTGTTGTTGTDL